MLQQTFGKERKGEDAWRLLDNDDDGEADRQPSLVDAISGRAVAEDSKVLSGKSLVSVNERKR